MAAGIHIITEMQDVSSRRANERNIRAARKFLTRMGWMKWGSHRQQHRRRLDGDIQDEAKAIRWLNGGEKRAGGLGGYERGYEWQRK